jgi:hypothetical protein
MTPPSTTHVTQPGGDSSGGADVLWYARAALSDATQHDDETVASACKILISHPDTDPDTWFRARDMLALVEGEMV